MIDDAERYMRMALNLAKRGIGSVEPNPAALDNINTPDDLADSVLEAAS